MKLSDETIAHIAKIIQLAILTGTDVVDHMRMIILENENNMLKLNSDYEKHSEENIGKMLIEIESLVSK